MPKIIDRTVCVKCKKNPPHRVNKCKECLAAYARQRYAENFKAEPHEYAKYKPSRTVLGIEARIRSKTSIRKSLSRKFGAQPEKKYRAADILKGAKNELA